MQPSRPRIWNKYLAVLLAALVAGNAQADWQAELPGARTLGQGEFSWFGLVLYTARLWGTDTQPLFEHPFALELTYRRTIGRDRLVETSVDEIRRQGGSVDRDKLARWTREMELAFVDVAPGSRITGVYLPGRGARFYSDGQLRREVQDVEFARAFFSIWLGPRTRSPELREALLGLQSPEA
jgi:hypothetical protein